MARRKRLVSHYQEAVGRLAGLRSIDPELNLAEGVSIEAYSAEIKILEDRLDAYNQALSKVDEAMLLADNQELVVRDFSERMLAGIAATFGKESEEYVMAGGTKKRRGRRKNKDGAIPGPSNATPTAPATEG